MLLSKIAAKAIAFIDAAVPDFQTLLNGIEAGTEVSIVDSSRDGIEQITAALASCKSIKSIHIVSHGSPGSIQLGSIWLNSDNLETYTQDLQKWSAALADDAEILLYGCAVAAGKREQLLCNKLVSRSEWMLQLQLI